MTGMSASEHRLPRLILLSYIATLATGIGVIFSLLAVIQDRFGFPTWSLGLLAGIPFATTLFGNIWLTPLADRGWERRLIGSGCVLLVLSLVWMVFAVDLWEWVAARAIMGLAEGVSVGAARRVMLSWEPERHGKALGAIMAAMLGGVLVGPVIGGALNELGPSLPFLVPAAAGVLVLLGLPRIQPGAYEQTAVRISRRGLATLPGFISGVLLAASNWLYIGVIDAIFARYMTDLGARPIVIGLGCLVIALPALLLTPASGRVADRVNPIRLALSAAVIGLPLLAGYGMVATVPALLVVGALHSACWVFVTLPGQAAVARTAPSSQAAEAQGLIEAYGFVLAAVGAFAGAPLYAAVGPRTLFLIATAVLALTPLAVFLRRARWRDAFR